MPIEHMKAVEAFFARIRFLDFLFGPSWRDKFPDAVYSSSAIKRDNTTGELCRKSNGAVERNCCEEPTCCQKQQVYTYSGIDLGSCTPNVGFGVSTIASGTVNASYTAFVLNPDCTRRFPFPAMVRLSGVTVSVYNGGDYDPGAGTQCHTAQQCVSTNDCWLYINDAGGSASVYGNFTYAQAKTACNLARIGTVGAGSHANVCAMPGGCTSVACDPPFAPSPCDYVPNAGSWGMLSGGGAFSPGTWTGDINLCEHGPGSSKTAPNTAVHNYCSTCDDSTGTAVYTPQSLPNGGQLTIVGVDGCRCCRTTATDCLASYTATIVNPPSGVTQLSRAVHRVDSRTIWFDSDSNRTIYCQADSGGVQGYWYVDFFILPGDTGAGGYFTFRTKVSDCPNAPAVWEYVGYTGPDDPGGSPGLKVT